VTQEDDTECMTHEELKGEGRCNIYLHMFLYVYICMCTDMYICIYACGDDFKGMTQE